MRLQAGPSSIPLEQTADVKKFINKREISVVAYFDEDTGSYYKTYLAQKCHFWFCSDSVLLNEFLESGNLMRTDMKLGHTHQRGVASEMGQEPGSIVVYHPV